MIEHDFLQSQINNLQVLIRHKCLTTDDLNEDIMNLFRCHMFPELFRDELELEMAGKRFKKVNYTEKDINGD